MNIIPVIDLLDGHAVWAQMGRRQIYRPLESPLCHRGEVLPLVQRLSNDYGFEQLYIADLDAIQRQGHNRGLLIELARLFPRLRLWIDAGFRHPADVRALTDRLEARPVVGSESWSSPEALPEAASTGAVPILSIDTDRKGLRDPSGIAADAGRWPPDLILMKLSRVGSGLGPDLGMLTNWRRRAPNCRLFAAGGVRCLDDVHRVREAGATGVLLASALHRSAFSASDLAAFC